MFKLSIIFINLWFFRTEMKRKLVKQGITTMMVSLPSIWIKQQHLQKGDEISIEAIDDNLIITAEIGRQAKKKTEINITNETESSIRTLIVNAYRVGYDQLEVSYENEKQYKTIFETITNYLIGFEVIRKEKESCTIENITEPSQEQFDVLFKKIFYNISLMINSTEERLKGQSKFEDYQAIDTKVKQYQNFCIRIISKTNPLGSKASLFWTFLGILVHGQRELYHLNKFLDSNRIKLKEKILLFHLKKVFNLLKEACFEKDIKKLEKIHEEEKTAVYKSFYKLIQTKGKENIIFYHLVLAIKNFYLAASPLIGMLLESSNSK